MKTVAIVLATYNSEKYICGLLDSLINQTYSSIVCYIHDDGSTDETISIIKEYEQKKQIEIIVLEYPPTGSAKANFISMLNFIKEDYAMFCDHDDIWHKDKVEQSVNYIKKVESGEPCLVFSDMAVVDEMLNCIDRSFMHYTGLDPSRTKLNQLLIQNVVPGCTCILNEKLYRIVRKCSHVENIRMHDQWTALVAAATSGAIHYMNNCTLEYRQHGDNEKGADENRSLLKRIKDVQDRIRRKSFGKENQEWHLMMTNQAKELLNLTEISEEARCFCEGFVGLQNKSKPVRVMYYLHNRVFRNKDNFWLLFWC